MTIDKVYAGAAVVTVAQGAFTPTVPGTGQTFTVPDDTGWPNTGEFPCKLNKGLSDEEHIVCTRVGTTFTVVTRGYDGTSAQTHSSPTIELYFDATSANLLVAHVDDDEADPHSTKLLNNARHDVTARHTFGGAYGSPATPTNLTPDNAAAVGTGDNPAKEDHVHGLPAATASTISGSNAEGTSPNVARADHDHAYTSASAIALTKTATSSAGSGVLALANHVHGTQNLPWGLIQRQTLTVDSSTWTGPATSDFALANVPTDVLRAYKVSIITPWGITGAADRFLISVHADGVEVQRVGDTDTGGPGSFNVLAASFLWFPASGTPDLDVRITGGAGAGTFQFFGSAADPRQFWVEDIGLR